MAKSKSKPLQGVHRVKKRLSGGVIKKYHYAFRGGPKFWSSDCSFEEGSTEYALAYAAILRGHKPSVSTAGRKITRSVIDRYRRSAHFVNLSERTRSDYGKYLTSFEEAFGDDPIKMFEEKEAVAEIREWKDRWAHSPKQYDYATSVVTRFLNWAMNDDASILVHHHANIARLYRSDRSDIVWLPEELRALRAVANDREKRVLIAASEGGLTPQDIGILRNEHVQKTPNGRRLFFRRTKSGKPVSIPVTPALSTLIETTPAGQEYLVVSLEGHMLTPERASGIVRDLKKRANAAAAKDSSLVHIRDELRLYDMRGTAATELLRAGCSLNEIAVTMGWGLRHAANIIEKYAAVVPEVADEVLKKLDEFRKNRSE
ncbi:MAG: integrase [Oceanibulbus sp.]|uniref:tyrosine-type recombinase/integrase n=1 Tax=Sulfitobacter dubius TaxID=218673 RepID=UPI000C6204EA|nr:integrase [Sulfitobacter sp.]